MNPDKQNFSSSGNSSGLTDNRSRGTCKASILLFWVGVLTVTVRFSRSVILTDEFVEKNELGYGTNLIGLVVLEITEQPDE